MNRPAQPVPGPLEPRPWTRRIAGFLVIAYAVISLIPLAWIILTSFRTPEDAISYPPKVIAEPSLVGYVNLFTTRTRVTPEQMAAAPPASSWYEALIRKQGMFMAGPSRFFDRYVNSLIVGFGSTFLAIVLGTMTAYALSRFKVPGKNDLEAASHVRTVIRNSTVNFRTKGYDLIQYIQNDIPY